MSHGHSTGKYRDTSSFEEDDDFPLPAHASSRPNSPPSITQDSGPVDSDAAAFHGSSYVFPSNAEAYPRSNVFSTTQTPGYNVLAPSHPVTVGTAKDLPVKGSREAPTKFTGRYTQVESFFEHYDRLLNKYNVQSDSEKCQGLLEYVSSSVKTLIHSSPFYHASNWTGLKNYLLKIYDAEKAKLRYKPRDVLDFAHKHHYKTCGSLSQWYKYCRRYQARAGLLRKQKKLSDLEYHGWFWMGIPTTLQHIIGDLMRQKFPNRLPGGYKYVDEVSAIAEEVFCRDRFEDMIATGPYLFGVDSRHDMSSDSESSGSDSDPDSSSSESDSRHKRSSKKKRKYSKKKSQKGVRSSPPTAAVPTMVDPLRAEEKAHTTKPQGNQEEISDIIRQLSALKIDDPAYRAVYYRGLQLDKSGSLEKC
ncbi:hypothetical protein BDP27DRAFT_1230244, partial [Rhodocollybia butyracea]